MACIQSYPPRTIKELRNILQLVDSSNPVVALMLEMSALTGLRYSDCSTLTIKEVTINGVLRESISVVQKKGYKKRLSSGMAEPAARRAATVRVSFSDQAKELIEEAVRLNPGGTLLFESDRKRGFPYSAQYVNRILKSAAVKLKLTYPLSSHSFRKAFALMLIENGAKSHTVRDLLGHASLASTDHYLSTFMSDNDGHVAKLKF
ncbi:tyrosine-type recombinase/integrase (plasmid) [Moritella sp. 24]|uniref:tyrosine-type recombinase/integrase n=1 Tax=Moritella sp. 24 TaxID=2746230 RepID=UPI001BAB5B33|nr:tyrosine-type recombinase/integrase [Moritella sp. 24]QUM78771.1 tyrosine-type recombinase/integrase [Moritella sp. 24]